MSKKTSANRRRPALAGAVPAGLKKADLLRLYERMMLVRRFELAAQDLNRKGVWPGFLHLYIGQEATAVGVCDHLRNDDWITSTHRGHGHLLAKGVPAGDIMAELYGKAAGCSGGRGGSMHMFAPKAGLLGTNGVVAGSIPLGVGAALSAKVRGTDQVSVAFFGDGASNHGAFLESLNFAAAQKLPVVFVCENNLYATATPLRIATANVDIASRGPAFGCPGVAVDGNDVLAVWTLAGEAVERARAGGGPTLIESRTYRWCGHHEGDPVCGTYRTEAEVKAWKKRCPLAALRSLLVDRLKLVSAEELDAIDRRAAEQVEQAVRYGAAAPDPDPATVHDHVLARPLNPPMPQAPSAEPPVQQGWMDAVRDGVAEEMRRNPDIVYLGEGVAERGGCFGHTKNLWQEFGGRRVIDTPICELAFTGASIGASATGVRAVADLMFADLLFEAGSQIVHQAAKLRYLSNGQLSVPVLVRAPMGMIKSAGAHHSGAYYPSFAHVPGLIVVVPSNPADAKGLVKTALRAGDPVLFLEHKAMFATRGLVPRGEHLLPLGQANVVRAGDGLTVVTCGLLVHRCLEAAARLEQQGVCCEVIDLRTIVPLDVQTIAASLAKTGRLLVVDEAWAMFGLGAEVAASMMELAFDDLDAPIGRLHTEPVPYPFSPVLEDAVAVTVDRIVAAAREVVAGTAPRPTRSAACLPPVGAPPTAASAVTPDREAVRPVAAPARPPEPVLLPGTVPVIMPNLDLTVTEAKIVRWVKGAGEHVEADQAIVEVETDKALVEVESPAAGWVVEILAQEGDVVKLGQRIAIIQTARGGEA